MAKKEVPSFLCLKCSQSTETTKVHICEHCGHIWIEGVLDNRTALFNLYEKIKNLLEDNN